MSRESKKPGEDETHQVFDGIVEQNNPLPGWWVGTFYLTVLFAFLYFAYYQLGPGPSLLDEYQSELAAIEKKNNPQGSAPAVVIDEESLKKRLSERGLAQTGKTSFDAKCSSCHGINGEGGIGPNLTDDYWIHGSKLLSIYKIIKDGVADKGMPPWGALLKEEEILQLVAYVKNLHGTKPANPKAPQGDKSTD